MYKINFYVPEDHLEQVKMALFAAGAGKVGEYDCCAWQVKGEGQFKPLTESHPFVGTPYQLETIVEYKVEMVCTEDCIHAAIAAMKKAHPYEMPAYQVIRMEDF